MKTITQLCPTCKTGEKTYLLDSSSLECPYLPCYNDFGCPYYMPFEKNKKENFIKKLLKKLKVL